MHKIQIAALAMIAGGCGSLVQEVSHPPPVYNVGSDQRARPENGDAPQWTEVNEEVQGAAHGCQVKLLNESKAINKSMKTDVGLAVAGGVIAIASGTSSTILGVAADQRNTGVNVATWSTAALAAAGGIVSLVSNIKQKASTTKYEARHDVWDEGFEDKTSNPDHALRRFTHCQSRDPKPEPKQEPEQVARRTNPRRLARKLAVPPDPEWMTHHKTPSALDLLGLRGTRAPATN